MKRSEGTRFPALTGDEDNEVTYGFIGFCLLMNSDVLIFNRLFRFIPGIRGITRAFAKLDDWITSRRGWTRRGLQVVGVAEKPKAAA